MSDRVQRLKSHPLEGLDRGKHFYYAHEVDALHASIIDQGRKVLNATSGISMSHADFIEWAIGELEK